MEQRKFADILQDTVKAFQHVRCDTTKLLGDNRGRLDLVMAEPNRIAGLDSNVVSENDLAAMNVAIKELEHMTKAIRVELVRSTGEVHVSEVSPHVSALLVSEQELWDDLYRQFRTALEDCISIREGIVNELRHRDQEPA